MGGLEFKGQGFVVGLRAAGHGSFSMSLCEFTTSYDMRLVGRALQRLGRGRGH